MSVSIFDFQHKQPLLETSFELAQRHLSLGDQVTYRFLGYDVPNVSFMSPITGSLLAGRWLPEQAAARLVADDRFTFMGRCRVRLRPLWFAVPDTLEDLQTIEHDGFDLGTAVASSLITRTGNSRVRPGEHRNVVRKMLQGAIAAHEYALDVLEAEKPDLVYLFNGRFAYERAVLRACQAKGIRYMIHERGCSPERYYLRPYTPHDRVPLQTDIRAVWKEVRDRADETDRAHTWFIERRTGSPRDWPSFTTGQVAARAPELASGNRIIAYFSSSDDEFESIGSEYRWEGWEDQIDAVKGLISIVDDLEDTELVIRVHPNLMTKHADERRRWMCVADGARSATLIGPESAVDTYTVMDMANIVVTSGSTMGVESVYWGRPSILLRACEYDALGVSHRAHNLAELRSLLLQPSIGADREAALPYGYHRATFGEPYKLYRPHAFSGGTFMGAELRPKIWRVAAMARSKVMSRFPWLGRPLPGSEGR